MDWDRGGGVSCLLEVPEGCSCQVNVLQCTLEGVETVFVVVVGGGYLSVFVWVIGPCLAVSTMYFIHGGACILYMVDHVFYTWWSMYFIHGGPCILYMVDHVFYTWWKVWPQPSSVLGLARGQGGSRCFPAVIMDQYESCCAVLAPSRWLMFRVVCGCHTGLQYSRCGRTRLQ